MKHVFVFDPDKCCGCSACAIACIDQNDIDIVGGEKSFRQAFTPELKTKEGTYCAYLSSACMHCVDAPCIEACPSGCLYKDNETGMTVYENDNCIGCRSCSMACPFGAPRYRPSDGKMVKCDGCSVRLKNGLPPACVKACTFGALTCITEDEYQKQKSNLAMNALVRALHG